MITCNLEDRETFQKRYFSSSSRQQGCFKCYEEELFIYIYDKVDIIRTLNQTGSKLSVLSELIFVEHQIKPKISSFKRPFISNFS